MYDANRLRLAGVGLLVHVASNYKVGVPDASSRRSHEDPGGERVAGIVPGPRELPNRSVVREVKKHVLAYGLKVPMRMRSGVAVPNGVKVTREPFLICAGAANVRLRAPDKDDV